MTPSQAIEALDRQLAKHGQPIFFARGAGAQQEMRGFVRKYTERELVGLIEQADRQIVISPSDLGAFGIPANKDRIATDGRSGTVEDIERVVMDGTLVRINLRVRLSF